ncbi:MAG: glycosyltransferase [Phycisphaerae bacterium]
MHLITRLIVGGAQENTLLSCEGLHQRGHEVILITGPSLGPEGSLEARTAAGGYRVVHLPSMVRNPHPIDDFSAYRALKKLFSELKPDVVHTHSSKAGIIGRAAAARVGAGLIVHTIHGLAFHPYQSAPINWLWIALERYAARRCDYIVCVADAMTRQALAAGIGEARQYSTIYSGMDVEPFLHPPRDRAAMRHALGIPQDRIVIGTLARLQPLKGHDDILKIAGQLIADNPQLHFLWIGDGVFRARLEQAIAAAGLKQHFTFTGLISPADVPGFLPAMDILVHPSYREGLPRALPQALLAGVAVIAYDCDGAAEVCRHRETGLLVQPGDVKALAQAIAALAGDAALRATLAEKGRDLCRRQFDAQVMVDKLDELYRRPRLR